MKTLFSNDQDLVERALEGDDLATEAIVLKYQRKAHAIARARLADAAQVDDVVQESFYQALRDLPQLRSRAGFGGWFFAIVRHVAGKQGNRSRPAMTPLEHEPADDRPPESLEWREVRDQIWEEIRALPLVLREAILLYYFDGESVREVAIAQGISTSLAKKRLQLGRDLLRENLRHRLGEVLHDLLPSARQWKQIAGRMTLVLLATLPCRRALEAASAVSLEAATCLAGAPGAPTTLLSCGSILAMKKLILVSVVLVSATCSFWMGRATQTSSQGAASPAGQERRPALSEKLKSLESSLDEATRRIADLKKENDSLRSAAVSLKKPAEAEEPKSIADGASREATLDWTQLSELVTKNIGAIDYDGKKVRATPEDEIRLRELFGELLKISSRAKAMTPNPFFREEIFTGLVEALMKGPLQLKPEQVKQIESACHEIFEGLPENPDELPALERYKLRQEVVDKLWQSTDGILDEDQLESLKPVQSLAENIFRYGTEYRFGIDTPVFDSNMTLNVLRGYDLQPDQKALAAPFLESYRDSAREVLKQYAEDQDALGRLPRSERRKLAAEFLDLQIQFDRQIEPLLSEKQRQEARRKDPATLQFEYGQGVSSAGYGSSF
jgi:RNA polymerase sigma-70 factor (ECF subfamily)